MSEVYYIVDENLVYLWPICTHKFFGNETSTIANKYSSISYDLSFSYNGIITK